MTRSYVLRRVGTGALVLTGAIFLVHAMVFLLPGDPVRRLAGNRVLSDSTYEALRERYHLDEPYVAQVGLYVVSVLHGDLGETLTGRPVSEIVLQRLPVTLRLALGAVCVELAIGLALGVLAALNRRTAIDHGILAATLGLIAVPTIVMSVGLQYVFGLYLGWMPVAGAASGWRSFLLPSIALGISSGAMQGRVVRATLLDNFSARHIQSAAARGLSVRRMAVHVLRNSAVPLLTTFGLDLAYLMGGAVFVERIFNLPGLGRELVLGIRAADGPLVLGIVAFTATSFIGVNLLVDLLCAQADRRIAYE